MAEEVLTRNFKSERDFFFFPLCETQHCRLGLVNMHVCVLKTLVISMQSGFGDAVLFGLSGLNELLENSGVKMFVTCTCAT